MLRPVLKEEKEINTRMGVIKIKQEVVEVEATLDDHIEVNILPDLLSITSHQKTRDFIEKNVTSGFNLNPEAEPYESRVNNGPRLANPYEPPTWISYAPNYHLQPKPSAPNLVIQNTQTSDFHNFLLKKDLIMNRFTSFNGDPATYSVWKASFKSIVDDLNVTPREETDLLVKWLGKESSKQALSLRTANIHNPVGGLRRIWDRLDERYGAPELIMSTLHKQISGFPRLQIPKDTHKLYDLVDILSEILCLKEDPKYAALLSFYDTSAEVNPILSKLPPFLQNKWMDRAVRYKNINKVTFPPFSYFSSYIGEMCSALNDPSFAFEQSCATDSVSQFSRETQRQLFVSSKKTDLKPACPLHPKSMSHSLENWKVFGKKPMEEKMRFLKEQRACFRCCRTDHIKRDCKTSVRCGECNDSSHITIMHILKPDTEAKLPSARKVNSPHGGEQASTPTVSSLCTAICGECFKGRPCAKTLAVRIHSRSSPERQEIVYAMLDEHCNRTLASPDLLDALGVNTAEAPYTLSSCSGSCKMVGRVAHDLIVQPMDQSCNNRLPTVIECTYIPRDVSEIPTPEIAKNFQHLETIKDSIPAYDHRI